MPAPEVAHKLFGSLSKHSLRSLFKRRITLEQNSASFPPRRYVNSCTHARLCPYRSRQIFQSGVFINLTSNGNLSSDRRQVKVVKLSRESVTTPSM